MNILSLLEEGDGRSPDAVALHAPGRTPLSYGALLAHVLRSAAALRRSGLNRDDTVAVVLANGPEMASAFLSVSVAAICAPLNPAYRADEFEFYLSDLPARALVIAGLDDCPAREVAVRMGIPVIELACSPNDAAGIFTLDCDNNVGSSDLPEVPGADDVALVLHTSGTTSRPKIVPLTHANLTASARNIASSLQLTSADRCLNVMPLFHIHGLVAALLASLHSGGSVVCTPGFLAPSFLDWIAEFRPTWYTAVPTMHASIVTRVTANRAAIESHGLRFIRSSSAALQQTIHAQLEETFGVPVIEAYGMTEAAHQMASNPLPPDTRKPGSVGRAAGPEIAVLDPDGQKLPPGVRGEIAIKGPNVTTGYARNPSANAAAFTNGWLRTGDEGVFDDEGYLTILGRLKEIINRGGEKISPLEVDEVLMAHPAVAQAVTFAAPDAVLGEEVAAVVVLQQDSSVSEREIREFVAVRLAHFKVPRRVLFVAAIPTGPTGKLQRIGLAERLGVSFEAPQPSPEKHVAPKTPMEVMLASIWSAVLGAEPSGVEENFFFAGGDSTLAAQFIARVRDTLAVEISLLAFFDAPTVSGLADTVGKAIAAHPRGGNHIPTCPDAQTAPLSFSQQMVWLSMQLHGPTAAYNRSAAMCITGPLDFDALQHAISTIVARHEILRTRIDLDDGTPRLHPTGADVQLEIIDLSTISEEMRPHRVHELLAEEAARPFDPGAGMWMRAGILKESTDANTLYITTHHIASDGWSDAVMFRELDALYGAFVSGKPSPLADLTTKYRDFAAWQRSADESKSSKNAEFWRGRLEGAPAIQELPVDRPRSDMPDMPDMPGMAGGQVTLTISLALAQTLETLGRDAGATPAMTTLAAFQLLQSRITGQADTVTGLSLAGRTHADTEGLIGLFNAVVPLRVTVGREMTFRDLLREVRGAMLKAHEHQSVPVDAILESLPHAAGVRHTELAQTLFNFRNLPAFRPSLPGLIVQPVETFNGCSVADLELEISETPAGWECNLRFRTELYDESTATRLLGHYRTLLESIAQNPDELTGRIPILTAAERRQILSEFNGEGRALPRNLRIHDLIQDQVSRSPLSVAVSWEGGDLTYVELDSRANALAHDLRARGVGHGSFVGICMERCPEMVVSLLAVLKSGAAIVPFDTDYPPERLAHMLADTQPALLLADSKGLSLLGAPGVETLVVSARYLDGLARIGTLPPPNPDPAAVACVLYTSGSTGLPKGVLSTHRGIANNLLAMQRIYALSPDDCMLQQTSLGFDAAAWEIFWPLTVGARMYLARPGGQRDADYLVRIIAQERIATVGFAPSMLKVMLAMPGFTACKSISRVMSYGEVISPSLREKFFARMPTVELHNLYGPTETSVAVTTWKCQRGSTRRSVPIGRPITNAELYILDGGMEPVPVGVAGEVYIGGVCVSNGYHDRADLTAERFPPHPFHPESGDRVYRTGDVARFAPDGVIEFIGRRDHQLKIRGVRVELEEIEAALHRLPAVRESVVVARVGADEEHRLVAYVAMDDDALSTDDIRGALEQLLPPQFIPAVIVPLREIPHGPNGKADRTALPDPSDLLPASSRSPAPPTTEMEKRLAAIWKDLLGLSAVSTRDTFFNLGGHSLLAVRMLQRAADEIGTTISLRDFYDHPTIHAMASILSGEAQAAAAGELPPILKVRESTLAPPFFYLNGQPPRGGRYANRLASYLPADQGLYIIPMPIFEAPTTVEQTAAQMIELIRVEQPEGPYILGGNCYGATLVLEIAQQLNASGERVLLVVLVHPDARTPVHLGFRILRRLALFGGVPESFHYKSFAGAYDCTLQTLREIWREQMRSSPRHRLSRAREAGAWVARFLSRGAVSPGMIWSALRSRTAREADEDIQDGMRQGLLATPGADEVIDQTAHMQIVAHTRHMEKAWTSYTLRKYAGPVTMIWPVEGPANPPWNPRKLWDEIVPALDWRFVPGNHWSMLHAHFEHCARAISDAVEKAREG